MTLIIEIALGIVLGGFLLANLNAILGLGMMLVFVVIGLGVLALVVYLLLDHWVYVALIIVVLSALVAVWWTYERINPERMRQLKRRIKERNALGYDTTQEREELAELVKKKQKSQDTSIPLSAGTMEKERARRRLLGYDD